MQLDSIESSASKLILDTFTARGESPAFTGACKKRDKDGKKLEERILTVGKHRVLVFKSNGKLDRDVHLLDLELASPKSSEVVLEVTSARHTREQLVFQNVDADEFINACRRAFLEAFPASLHAFKVLVDPASRLEQLDAFPAPCGGYADSYRAICDHMGLIPRDDVISNCTITLPVNGIHEFDLSDYDPHLMVIEELRAILVALQYNTYFVALLCPRTWKLGERETQLIADLLRVNTSLQELRLASNSRDGLIFLAHAIRDNKGSTVTVIDLSGSTIEDKAAVELGAALVGLSHGLVHADLSKCDIGRVGMSGFWSSLRRHPLIAATLLELSLSYNKLEADGSAALAQFLSKPNLLRKLRLNYCAANLDQLLAALLMGSPDIVQLHVSGNRISRKEGTQLVKYLQASAKLLELELADTQLPVDVLRDVLKAVFTNSYLRSLRLGLASNKLGTVGANMIANIWHEGSNIEELNLQDNELGDEGIVILCEALVKSNTLLKGLWLGQNFSVRTAQRNEALQALCTFLNSPGCALTSLHLEGGSKHELKADLLPLLNVLATNEALLYLDISGHACGDRGTLALARALQTNHTLQRLSFDENQTGLAGFSSLRRALDRNRTLCELALPLSDIAALTRSVGEAKRAVFDVISELERAVARNRVGRPVVQPDASVAPSSQLAQMYSGERQSIERLRTKIQSLGRRLLPVQQSTMEDAERVEEHVTALLLLKESVVQQLGDLLTQSPSISGQLSQPLETMRSKLVQTLMQCVKDRFHTISEADAERLRTKLNSSASMSVEDIDRVIASNTLQSPTVRLRHLYLAIDLAMPEVTRRSQRTLQALVDAAVDFVLHKLATSLQTLSDELIASGDAHRRIEPIPSRSSAGQLVKMSESPMRVRESLPKAPESPKRAHGVQATVGSPGKDTSDTVDKSPRH